MRGAAISTKYSGFTHYEFKTSWLRLCINKVVIVFLCALVPSSCTCVIMSTQSQDCPHTCSPTGRFRRGGLSVTEIPICGEDQAQKSEPKHYHNLWKDEGSYASILLRSEKTKRRHTQMKKDIRLQSNRHFEHLLKSHFLNTVTWEICISIYRRATLFPKQLKLMIESRFLCQLTSFKLVADAF